MNDNTRQAKTSSFSDAEVVRSQHSTFSYMNALFKFFAESLNRGRSH